MAVDQSAVAQHLEAQLGREPTRAEIETVLAVVSMMAEPKPQEPTVAGPTNAASSDLKSDATPAPPEPAKAELPQTDSAMLDTSKLEAIQAEAAKLEESARAEASLAEAEKQKAAQVEAARVEAAGTGQPGVSDSPTAPGLSGGAAPAAAPEAAAIGSAQNPAPAYDFTVSASFQWPGAAVGPQWEQVTPTLTSAAETEPLPMLDKEKVEIWEEMSHGMHALGDAEEDILESSHEKKVADGTSAHLGAKAPGDWHASVGVAENLEKDLGRVELGSDGLMLGAAVVLTTAGVAASKAWDKLSSALDGEAELAPANPQPEVATQTPEPNLDKALAEPTPNIVEVGEDASTPSLERNEMAAYALNHLRDPVSYPSLGPEMDEQLAPFESALQAVDHRIDQELAADPGFAEVSDLYRESEYQQVYDGVIDMYGAADQSYLEASTSVEPALQVASEASSLSSSMPNEMFADAGVEVTGPTISGATSGMGAGGL